jgi:hypothetical protein
VRGSIWLPPGGAPFFVNPTFGEMETRGMNSTLALEAGTVLGGDIDLVEEMRLRTWARRNHVASCEREDSWHPVILDEMARIDEETAAD